MKKTIKRKDVVWLQITAGQGPRECGWVVTQLSRKIMKEAMAAKLVVERIETLAFDKGLRKQHVIEPDAFLSVLLRLEGEGAISFSRQWEGDVKWLGVSPFRPRHKRTNWFVGVFRLANDESNADDVPIHARDIEVTSTRSGGPGGQHVNKTNSAVRLTHKPSGIQVRVESARSQHRNKALALERLAMLLAEERKNEQKQQDRSRWLSHYQVNRGNPARTFAGADFIEQE